MSSARRRLPSSGSYKGSFKGSGGSPIKGLLQGFSSQRLGGFGLLLRSRVFEGLGFRVVFR